MMALSRGLRLWFRRNHEIRALSFSLQWPIPKQPENEKSQKGSRGIMSKQLAILAFGILVVLANPDLSQTEEPPAKSHFNPGSRKVESSRLVLPGLNLRVASLPLRLCA